MILTDREILVALDTGQIEIDPPPNQGTAISSTAIDLTLADKFSEWNPLSGMTIKPSEEGYKFSEFRERFEKVSNGAYELKPRSFVLGWSEEYIRLPIRSRIAARVEGKSSLARLGVGVHVTAPTIHAGFSGQIQLEIFNLGPFSVELNPGMFVCQLIFEQTLGTPAKGYDGSFSGQTA